MLGGILRQLSVWLIACMCGFLKLMSLEDMHIYIYEIITRFDWY